MRNRLVILVFIFSLLSCRSDNEITRLLKSSNHEDVIEGAFEAGESGNNKFVPLLLNDAYDPSASVTLNFKGFTVYQEKMGALEKIFKRSPPNRISGEPDSAVLFPPAHQNLQRYTTLLMRFLYQQNIRGIRK